MTAPALPVVPLPNPERLPDELRQSNAWILWRAEWERKKDGSWKLNKVPCDAGGRTHDMTAESIRGPIGDLLRDVEHLRADRGQHFGVGITFCGVDGFFALDLDGDLAGPAPSERLQWLIDNHPTWMETSISGAGVHLFYRGKADGKRKFPWRGSPLEVFGSAGFIAVTGQVFLHPGQLADGVELPADEIKRKPSRNGIAPAPAPQVTGTDAEILGRMFASNNGSKARDLWDGGGSEDVSAGDLALVNYLAFWCGGPDAGIIDRLFRQSARMRAKWDHVHSRTGRTYGQMTIEKALDGRTDYWRLPPKIKQTSGSEPVPDSESDGGPPCGWQVIRDYFIHKYGDGFRTADAVFSNRERREIRRQEATAALPPDLIIPLGSAVNAPAFKGGSPNPEALPGFFKKWAGTGWAAFLQTMPDEDAAEDGSLEVAADEFRRLVRQAMLSEFQVSRKIRSNPMDPRSQLESRIELRSAIGWCQVYAKPGSWKTIRSKQLWCKEADLGEGETQLRVAIRHEFFSQVKADRRLIEMGSNTFSRRARRYGVGKSGGQDDRPAGKWALVLADEFVRDLTATLPDDMESCTAPEPATQP